MESREKLITIVIPSYNMEKYLEKAVNSLLIDKRLLDDLEVIIVNDGSTDNTLEIASRYINRYPSVVKIINKSNGNYGSCINSGLSEARGKFIKILDADDYFDTIAFERYVSVIKESERNGESVDLFINDGRIVFDDGSVGKTLSVGLARENDVVDIASSSELDKIKKLTHHLVTYRTQMLKDIKYEQAEGVMYSDQEWVCLPFLGVTRYKYLRINLYNYLVGRAGQSMASFYKNLSHQLAIKKHLIGFFQNAKKGESRTLVFEIIVSYLVSAYRHYLIEAKDNSKNNEIVEFDEYLKRTDSNFYNGVNSAVVSDKYRFHFINRWRKNKYSFFYVFPVFIWRRLHDLKARIRKK